MVARQRQLPAEHGLDGPELGVSSVVAGRGRLVVTDLDFVDDTDDVFARVSGRVAHDHEQARLGALQNRLESTIQNLETTAENLSASRSRITDTDFAAETAHLSKNQIIQNAGVSILSQANQLNTLALNLLQ